MNKDVKTELLTEKIVMITLKISTRVLKTGKYKMKRGKLLWKSCCVRQ